MVCSASKLIDEDVRYEHLSRNLEEMVFSNTGSFRSKMTSFLRVSKFAAKKYIFYCEGGTFPLARYIVANVGNIPNYEES